MNHDDEARVEQNSSLRVKLFKESRRQAPVPESEAGRGGREPWDRRQAVRVSFGTPRGREGDARP